MKFYFLRNARKIGPRALNGDIVFDVVNSFPSKGFPIDRVKSVSALRAHSAVKGLSTVLP